MSIDITNKVWERGPLDAKQRLLLMAIADHANQDGRAYPGVELLARKSCQSVRNALRGILKLEREGWIVVLRRRAGERARGNEYLVNLARLSCDAVVEKTAAAANLSRHDTVSPRAAIGEANTAACASPSDTVSCGEMEDELQRHEVTESRHEVTKRASRGDKNDPRIENRKEPSVEPIPPIAPQGGRDGNANATAETHEQLRGFWEVANRIRARQGKQAIAWETWLEEFQPEVQAATQGQRGFSSEMQNGNSNRIETGNSNRFDKNGFRRVRKSRRAAATVGVFRGG